MLPTDPTHPTITPRSKRDRNLLIWALIAWGVFAVVICIGTALKNDVIILAGPADTRLEGRIIAQTPEALTLRIGRGEAAEDRVIPAADQAIVSPLGGRSVTGVYRHGAELWWQRKPMYTQGVHGFLYLPQAALVFSPFAILPPVVGEVLWRIVGIAVYAFGVWRLLELLLPVKRRALGFFLATLLAIPAALGSAQNGQTNLIMGGLFALAAWSAAQRRWWWMSLWLMLALACKPIALVLLLLLGAVFPRSIPALLVGLIVLALAPFVHPDPAYVWAQYPAAFAKMSDAARPDDLFQDLRGLIASILAIGDRTLAQATAIVPDTALMLVRALAAPLTLVVCLAFVRRGLGHPLVAVFTLAMGTAYLMLFNPRTEGVTYALIGPVAAAITTLVLLNAPAAGQASPAQGLSCLAAGRSRQMWLALAIVLVAYCLILQFSRVLTGGPNYFVRPLATIVFIIIVNLLAFRSPLARVPSLHG